MNDFAGPWAAAKFTPGDVTVTPASPGYNIGIVDGAGWRFVNTAETWAQAVRKASWLSGVRGGRVWGSREGVSFDPLIFEQIGLDGDYGWFALDARMIDERAPSAGGIYVLRAKAPIYIGETENLRERLLFHLENPFPRDRADGAIVFACKVIDAADKRHQRNLELVTWWKPPCNA